MGKRKKLVPWADDDVVQPPRTPPPPAGFSGPVGFNEWMGQAGGPPELRITRINTVINSLIDSHTTREGDCRLEDIRIYCSGYSEPGYAARDNAVVCTGNWNVIGSDRRLRECQEILATMGVPTEWSDEWTDCDRCGGLVRTSLTEGQLARGGRGVYDWQPAYTQIGAEDVCHKCLRNSVNLTFDYLRSLEGRPQELMSVRDIDPDQFGYRLLRTTDSPRFAARDLREQGVTRFIFAKCNFRGYSVWVHQDEIAVARANRTERPVRPIDELDF